MELGLYSFGERTPDPHSGHTISARQRIREMVDAAKLAEDVGLEVFGVGEHHRLDFAVSATPVVMAAMAEATERIRLTSAVTILSTADPVRVFEDFATVDLLSGGRAELIVGRGAFVESFPLFGFDLADYDDLFIEKLGLLLRLNELGDGEPISWEGSFRPALEDAEVSPRPESAAGLPIWIGVGGNPTSAVRAGTLGKPMALAIIGGSLPRIKPTVDLYRQAGTNAGHDPAALKVGINSHLHVADTSQAARDGFYPYYSHYFAAHHPRHIQISRSEYDQLAGPTGALFVGSPQEIVDKILYEHELFGHDRFLAQLDIGGQPYATVARAIELLGSEVLPVVQRETAAAVA
ncbi:MAG TPA: LLM class flavin-dependent oxidoreductase [Acidimicrobiales bacterium]|nr:LLM class flavin-dependent oxidoreductase [Acidimicrobiales bacterium]